MKLFIKQTAKFSFSILLVVIGVNGIIDQTMKIIRPDIFGPFWGLVTIGLLVFYSTSIGTGFAVFNIRIKQTKTQ
ncbi:MAG: hypothetical protein HYW77_01965 [Parcubacteria group bacterium]|nr:hypothetical protein [Parcubacteria group bacterium]